MKKSVKNPSEATQSPMRPSPSDQSAEMYAYFKQHGWYRPQDLLQVLGDPLERVEIAPDPDFTTAASKQDK
jgi:hypothetical protein